MTAAASCGSVSAPALGLPDACAIPEAKGTLPKGMFAGKGPISNTLRQHFVRDVASIHFLALLRPANTGLADGARIHEIMMLGLRMNGADAAVPTDVIEHIAAQRPNSGVLFVVVREGHTGESAADGGETLGKVSEQCALAVRRRVPGRAGHVAQFAVHASEWQDPRDILLEIEGMSLDEAWESLCSQAILGETNPADLDARLLRRDRIKALKAEEAKLARDHGRAKNPTQRNEIFAKLHKVRKELETLGQ